MDNCCGNTKTPIAWPRCPPARPCHLACCPYWHTHTQRRTLHSWTSGSPRSVLQAASPTQTSFHASHTLYSAFPALVMGLLSFHLHSMCCVMPVSACAELDNCCSGSMRTIKHTTAHTYPAHMHSHAHAHAHDPLPLPLHIFPHVCMYIVATDVLLCCADATYQNYFSIT